MASNINTTNIDTAYPVAGQDNDSQGFRDNFTNINKNFVEAKKELKDLQNKVILKSALTGSSLDNDMNGASITDVKLITPKIETRTIASSVGVTGDVTGDVAVDSTSIYYCIADYDGATNIWVKQDWGSTGAW